MKLNITGASTFVNRMFEACGNYQWAREFLKNSLEAGATKIEYGIEWQAVEKLGVYRRTVADNGSGMNSDELLRFFSTLGDGAKKIGGVHDNFGVGAKIAALPWNSEGVVVISYKNGKAAMIWIVLDPESGDYELVDFEVDGEKHCSIQPAEIEGIDWSKIKPDWLTDHGTVIILLGSEDHPDTVLGNPLAGEKEIKGLSVYLNTRFWDLTNCDVRVVELRSEKKSQWPQASDDRDNARRPNNRTICGAKHYLTKIVAENGSLKASDVLLADSDRVSVEWYLWEGERPHVDSYAKKTGYIAIRYNDELFQVSSSKAHFRWFGVIESKVQQCLTLIIEPQHYLMSNGRWGIHPDQSRNRLIFTGNGEKGVEIPLSDWGSEFAENMPDAVREAIRKARGSGSGTIDDEDYRKRLQDKFGNRWTVKRLVKAAKEGKLKGIETNDSIEVIERPEHTGERTRRKRPKTVKVVSVMSSQPGGTGFATEKDIPVDVPRYRLATADEFEKPWHLALWAPHSPDGSVVLINIDSPILTEVIQYHQNDYPEVYSEEVAKIIRQVFGEVAACKIAHSQKLAKHIAAEQLDAEYRNEQALTIALMGLLAEESLISQRLGKLGRKRVSEPTLT